MPLRLATHASHIPHIPGAIPHIVIHSLSFLHLVAILEIIIIATVLSFHTTHIVASHATHMATTASVHMLGSSAHTVSLAIISVHILGSSAPIHVATLTHLIIMSIHLLSSSFAVPFITSLLLRWLRSLSTRLEEAAGVCEAKSESCGLVTGIKNILSCVAAFLGDHNKFFYVSISFLEFAWQDQVELVDNAAGLHVLNGFTSGLQVVSGFHGIWY